MNKYKFNHKLLKNLLVVLGLSKNEFESITGIRMNQFYYWNQINDIPFDKLLIICETLHIPVSHFIIPFDNEMIIGTKDDYIHTDKWHTIKYDFLLANQHLTIKRRMTVRSICSQMECSSKTYVKIFSKNIIERVMLGEILRLFGKVNLCVGYYIIDDNIPIEVSDASEDTDNSEEYIMYLQQCAKNGETQIKNYQSRLTTARKKIDELQKEIARLKKSLAMYEMSEPVSVAAESTK